MRDYQKSCGTLLGYVSDDFGIGQYVDLTPIETLKWNNFTLFSFSKWTFSAVYLS